MSSLDLTPPRVPLVDGAGNITREWFRFFQGLYNRAGGATGASTTDLTASSFEDSGIEEAKAFGFGLERALFSLPPAVSIPADPDLLADLASLRAEVDALRTIVAGLQSGVTL